MKTEYYAVIPDTDASGDLRDNIVRATSPMEAARQWMLDHFATEAGDVTTTECRVRVLPYSASTVWTVQVHVRASGPQPE